MEKSKYRAMTRILKWILTITFICNLIVLLLVPGLVTIGRGGGQSVLRQVAAEDGIPLPLVFLAVCWQALPRVWLTTPTAVLAAFLLGCGVCTAIILWQGRQVVVQVEKGRAFSMENAKYASVAGTCSFIISALALVRLIWSLVYYRSGMPFFAYNTLFIPVFFAAGLMLYVLSVLIRQAAELKAENDLTI